MARSSGGSVTVAIDRANGLRKSVKRLGERVLPDLATVITPYVEASQSGVAGLAQDAGMPIVASPVGELVEQVGDGTPALSPIVWTLRHWPISFGA